jgi:dipeptidyl-peptidase 4
MTTSTRGTALRAGVAFLAVLAILPQSGHAQDRLTSMPGYEAYRAMAAQIPGAIRSGALTVTWLDGGRAFEYEHNGTRYRYDVARRRAVEIAPKVGAARRPGRTPERGRQHEEAMSPDSSLRAPSTAIATSGEPRRRQR